MRGNLSLWSVKPNESSQANKRKRVSGKIGRNEEGSLFEKVSTVEILVLLDFSHRCRSYDPGYLECSLCGEHKKDICDKTKHTDKILSKMLAKSVVNIP